jgi:hypothetical protein
VAQVKHLLCKYKALSSNPGPTKKLKSWIQWVTPVIPAMWEVEIRRIVVPGQPGQTETLISMNEKLGMVVHTCYPIYAGSLNRRLWSPGWLGHKCETLSQK